jgi:hypothetical protein
LQSDVAPDPIKRFFAEAPDWLEVRPSHEIDPAPRQLDSGEREVITLALSTGADSVRRRGCSTAFEAARPELNLPLLPCALGRMGVVGADSLFQSFSAWPCATLPFGDV